MAASVLKACPSSFSFLIQSLVRCPVRYARSDVFRRSVRIITPEEQEKLLLKKQGYIVDNVETSESRKCDEHFYPHETHEKKTKPKNVRKSDFTKEKTPNLLRYEKLEEGDKRFGVLVTNAKSKKLRQKTQQILLEGQRLISDALLAGAKCCSIYFTSEVDPNKLPLDPSSQIPIYKVKYKHLKLWSDVVTPSGIMGVFKMPAAGECMVPQTEMIPLTLICDSIQDSGNMGSLIRTAAAVGCQRILTTVGSVDVWEPKVIRSGCGSHFRIPILNGISWSQIPNYISSDARVLLASASLNDQLTNSNKNVLSFEELDSLVNLCEYPPSENDPEIVGKEELSNDSKENDYAEHLYTNAPIPSKPYQQFSFDKEQTVLIIGSESHGLSSEAKKLAFSHYGHVIYIPLANGVESLNSVVAAGIIMFEIRKQIDKRLNLKLNMKKSVKRRKDVSSICQ